MQIDLTGKNALVTGGTRGIGRAISLTLAGCGARVAAIYRRDEEAAARTIAELPPLPGGEEHFALKADIADEAQAKTAVGKAVERFGGALDLLILDAGVVTFGSLCGSSTEEWMLAFDVNLHGAFHVVRAAGPALRAGGSVVFISSGAGHDPIAGMASYGASKAAINQMAAVLAQELGPHGVRVNVVSPGHTEKEDADPDAPVEGLTERQQHIVRETALRRLGSAFDVANAVLFFASDLSGFVTGQWLRVNGGRV